MSRNFNVITMLLLSIKTILQNKRMQWGEVPLPPSIIFERLKLPQQITYLRKGNLSESPNRFKYRKYILILRFYEQFLRISRNLGHFGSSKNSNFAVLRRHFRISRNSVLLLSSRNLNIPRNKLYIWNLQITRFKMTYRENCS